VREYSIFFGEESNQEKVLLKRPVFLIMGVRNCPEKTLNSLKEEKLH